MSGLREDVLDLAEVPALDGSLILDVHLSLVELELPPLQDRNSPVDVIDCIGDWLLLEDRLNVNFITDLLTNFIRNGLYDVLELIHLVVDVTRDRPDQLQAVQ